MPRKKDRLLTAREVGDALRLGRSSVYRMMDEGLLPYIEIRASRASRLVRRVPLSAVQAILDRADVRLRAADFLGDD